VVGEGVCLGGGGVGVVGIVVVVWKCDVGVVVRKYGMGVMVVRKCGVGGWWWGLWW